MVAVDVRYYTTWNMDLGAQAPLLEDRKSKRVFLTRDLVVFPQQRQFSIVSISLWKKEISDLKRNIINLTNSPICFSLF